MLNLEHFSLFTGIAGLDIAAEWAGFKTVGQCEWADYPTKVLEKHWPDVPRWRNVKDVNLESVRNKGIGAITVMSGGDNCQPHSLAGNRSKQPRGQDDERYMWPEMFRVIRELKPNWIVNENVAGSLSNGTVDQKILDLEDEGYTVAPPFVLPAFAVGAIHQRYRVFVIAYSEWNANREEWEKESCNREIGRMGRIIKPMAWDRDWESALREFRRVDDGLSYRMDRLNTLRNAVVPQQAYPIFKTIADIERMMANE